MQINSHCHDRNCLTERCPLWVKSGHVWRTSPCPLSAKSGHSAYSMKIFELITATGLTDNRSPIAPIDEYHSFARKTALNEARPHIYRAPRPIWAEAIALRNVGSLLPTIRTGCPAPSSDLNVARAGRYDLDLPSLRSAAPSHDRKNENSNAHGITPVQNYICQRSFIIGLRGNHVQMAKDMQQRFI